MNVHKNQAIGLTTEEPSVVKKSISRLQNFNTRISEILIEHCGFFGRLNGECAANLPPNAPQPNGSLIDELEYHLNEMEGLISSLEKRSYDLRKVA